MTKFAQINMKSEKVSPLQRIVAIQIAAILTRMVTSVRQKNQHSSSEELMTLATTPI